jgi:phosphate transport system substrate-binding protein
MLKKIAVIALSIGMGISALSAQTKELLGAGATFPQPLYSKMFQEYSKKDVNVNYQAIGSGGGINQLIAKTTDFGGTDAIMSSEEESKAGAPILHIPTCLGAVVVSYNLQLGANQRLKMSPALISDIFLGKIVVWNDKRIAAENPGIKLPALPITVVYRSDGSGTTYIFTEYLAKVSTVWDQTVGNGKSVKWPIGIGAKGNPGVAGTINQTPGAIGYVELIYALSNKMPYALVKNKAGKYINPDMKTVSLAAAKGIPANTKVSLTNTDSKDGYPISSFTWIILYKEQNYNGRSLDQAKKTVELIKWMVTSGQNFAPSLHYAKLPKDAQTKALALLNSVTFNGKPIK